MLEGGEGGWGLKKARDNVEGRSGRSEMDVENIIHRKTLVNVRIFEYPEGEKESDRV